MQGLNLGTASHRKIIIVGLVQNKILIIGISGASYNNQSWKKNEKGITKAILILGQFLFYSIATPHYSQIIKTGLQS